MISEVDNTAIDVNGLVKLFGAHRVLGKIDLKVRRGEFLTLVGPSGCGKSTLLRLIAGLETASEGDISIAGRDVTKAPPKQRDVAMVFQNYALYPHLTVAQNMSVPLRMRRLGRLQRFPLIGSLMPQASEKLASIKTEVEAAARSLAIEHLLARKPAQLSGGQRQRVALGRAIVRKPQVFLLDEPLSNLDAQLRVHMRSELVQLHRRLGVTLIYVTHDQAEAMTMSSRIAVMFAGQILQIGTPDAVYDNPDHLKVAQFISNPGLNTLPLALILGGPRGRQIDDSLGTIAASGSDLTVGFRPEACALAASAAVADLSGRVLLCERFGAEAFIHVLLHGASAPVIVRVEPSQASVLLPEDVVHIQIDASKIFVFGQDGTRVRDQRRAAA
ncbi:ABC transporter ATP-binding protein [Neorhizobium galegae]|uniref:ABC transporter ATP-binding protein n=1 Tax=Neorhizobium galegae TaxID=399 RepID=UPI0006220FC7|nr:ABC transporter ATP-binding protein [Neorhizobium galegae]KAB1120112.1 ABC transporter ATP-binding protein [Neorhizobium galegae]CDZ64441.1 Sn-glycerol-3-phosphate import ATP-binding protein UgpC [Neorhizobium galegae bv. orientalis]CDZ73938.1 Sn-glycerol-3-phosphate import ATP-binding protein UgpC [Neorhizobium galegae bv. orientalis]